MRRGAIAAPENRGICVRKPPLTPGPHYRDDDEAAGARAAGLIAVAEDLAGEFSLRPLLERILLRCTELLGCDAGSICSVDEAAGTYRKEADIGSCLPVRSRLPAHRGDDRGRSGTPRPDLVRPVQRCPRWSRGARRTGRRSAASSAYRSNGGGASSAPASCSAGMRGARSARRTPSCCSCSPSTPRSRWPTPACTSRPRSGPGPRRPPLSASGCCTRSMTRSRSGWSSVRVHLETAEHADAPRGRAGDGLAAARTRPRLAALLARPARPPGTPWRKPG